MGKKEYPGVSEHGENLRISFTWRGKRYRPTLPWKQTAANKAKASKLYLEVKQLIKTGIFSHKLLAEYFPEYGTSEPNEEILFCNQAQTYLNVAEVSANTRTEYRKILNRYWMPELAPIPITDIKSSELKTITAGIAWSSAKTRNNAVSVLRQVFELAVDDELIDSNPADKIKNLKHQKPPVDPFTEDEANKIIKDLYQQHPGREIVYAAYFEFAFWTGMRTSEMMALKWDDIDWNQKTARVEKAQTKGRLNNKTKTSKVRDVMLNDRAMEALKKIKPYTFLQGQQIFLSPRTSQSWKTDKSPRRPFNSTLKRLGIRHRKPYNTRHTYATVMLMRGINPAFAAAQLGHSLQVFLNTYAKWIHGEQSKTELEKLKIGPELAHKEKRQS